MRGYPPYGDPKRRDVIVIGLACLTVVALIIAAALWVFV